MTNQHPITPPPELVKQWLAEPEYVSGWNGKCVMLSITDYRFNNICAKAAQWGADQELEACVKWFDNQTLVYHRDLEHALLAARRPKPPSRKEQALEAIGRLCASVIHDDLKNDAATIRRAIEQLPD